MAGTLRNIWKAVRQLNPGRITKEAGQDFTLALVGLTEAEIVEMRIALLGPDYSDRDAELAAEVTTAFLQPLDESKKEIKKADLVLAVSDAASGLRALDNAVLFDSANPAQSISQLISRPRGRELRLALARRFPALRAEVSRKVIQDVSRENATFVIVTALGDVIPSVLEPILGVAEAAGDTVFLTANQVRMLFAIAAAHGEAVGYALQWKEISSIIGAAFGWRTLARNLVSKIPFGGGLAPKGAIAYAGTYAVGEGARFFYATGRRMTREEVGQLFKQGYSDAIEFARGVVGRLRPGATTADSATPEEPPDPMSV